MRGILLAIFVLAGSMPARAADGPYFLLRLSVTDDREWPVKWFGSFPTLAECNKAGRSISVDPRKGVIGKGCVKADEVHQTLTKWFGKKAADELQ